MNPTLITNQAITHNIVDNNVGSVPISKVSIAQKFHKSIKTG